ncbi:hypothetical protein QQF64_021430 [Cirrhinus molitorella]|uniref:Uncharacterized protein n=1 Tax=Cirrhinus molitorella TaxID=172907 RepID=A0ABR3LDE6_9TELE
MIYGRSPSFRIIHQSTGLRRRPPVVNHSESLSLISINRSSVALVPASLTSSLSLSLSISLALSPRLPPPAGAQPSVTRGFAFHIAAFPSPLFFHKLTTFRRAAEEGAMPFRSSEQSPPPTSLLVKTPQRPGISKGPRGGCDHYVD